MTCPSQFRWTSSARSDAGRVREINEDACLAQPEPGRWAVADGMGGHAVGDLASRLVIDALSRLTPPLAMKTCIADARARLQKANRQLRDE
ncbi:MAG: PP2C family protein-serine/threonine phosphatase, partial [Paraburkholderia nemoris]